MTELDRIYAKENKVVVRQVAGENVLVPIKGTLVDMQMLYIQEGIAAFIWSLIDGEHTLHYILDEIVKAYQVALTQAEDDLMEFVASLEESSLIRLLQ